MCDRKWRQTLVTRFRRFHPRGDRFAWGVGLGCRLGDMLTSKTWNYNQNKSFSTVFYNSTKNRMWNKTSDLTAVKIGLCDPTSLDPTSWLSRLWTLNSAASRFCHFQLSWTLWFEKFKVKTHLHQWKPTELSQSSSFVKNDYTSPLYLARSVSMS